VVTIPKTPSGFAPAHLPVLNTKCCHSSLTHPRLRRSNPIRVGIDIGALPDQFSLHRHLLVRERVCEEHVVPSKSEPPIFPEGFELDRHLVIGSFVDIKFDDSMAVIWKIKILIGSLSLYKDCDFRKIQKMHFPSENG
jgi:hypothetical protein